MDPIAIAEILSQIPDTIYMLEPFSLALILNAATQTGIGIVKMIKGRKIEKQAISDRSNYINLRSDWVMNRQIENLRYKDIIETGRGFRSDIPTVGKTPYSSLQQGREQQEKQIGSYMNTLGNISSPSGEKSLMAAKYGLNK